MVGFRIPKRVDRTSLDEMLKNPKNLHKAQKGVDTALEEEDFLDHEKALLGQYRDVKRYVKSDPRYRELLRTTMDEVYGEYKHYLTGAKIIDGWDMILSAAGGLVNVIPIAGQTIGQAASWVEEGIEMIPKVAYAAWYANGTQDYDALGYWAKKEALSFIPVVGDIVDLKRHYVARSREMFRRKVAERFLQKVRGEARPPGTRKQSELDEMLRDAA